MLTAHELAAVPLLAGAEAEALEPIRQHGYVAEFGAGALLADFDDPGRQVYFIMRGAVRVVLRTPGGREVIFRDQEEGSFVGELAAIDGAPRSAAITALRPTRALVVPPERFLETVTRAPVVCRRLLALLAGRLRDLSVRMAELSLMSTRQRVAAVLLRDARPRTGSEVLVISPPPQQHVLAARIGARRESVSREIAAFEREGLITLERGALVILNAKRLAEIAAAEREG
ncbi:Crp/Fnr family transcriptional regulator [Elioraea sp.]|uniref:Crp/Fnr family transcriptional regulator n=1 Tax=Elioraea sp. TaxID=2185103 RepID=UPI003F729469